MKPYEIGLATGSASVTGRRAGKVAAALRTQAADHVLPIWGVTANVKVVDRDNVPPGVWPIVIIDQLPNDAHGFHSFDGGCPTPKCWRPRAGSWPSATNLWRCWSIRRA